MALAARGTSVALCSFTDSNTAAIKRRDYEKDLNGNHVFDSGAGAGLRPIIK
jgi:hypothetical protein